MRSVLTIPLIYVLCHAKTAIVNDSIEMYDKKETPTRTSPLLNYCYSNFITKQSDSHDEWKHDNDDQLRI